MGFLLRLLGFPDSIGQVEAMCGICVHDPDVMVEPPSDAWRTAATALSARYPRGTTLPITAKVQFLTAQGGMSLRDSQKQEENDLPKLLRDLLTENELAIDDYVFETFVEKLRPNIRVVWAAAVLKDGKAQSPGQVMG